MSAAAPVIPDSSPIVLEKAEIRSWKAPIAFGVFVLLSLILFFGFPRHGESTFRFSEAGDAQLKWQREWRLKTAPDNLKWAGDRLLVGAHRQLLTLLLHSLNPKRYRAPSQLIAISGLPGAAEIEELHATRAQGVEAVASGVHLAIKNRLVMGGIYGTGILDCAAPGSFEAKAPDAGSLPL